MKLYCDMCGSAFEGNDKAPVPARYCHDCHMERRRMVNRRLYRENRHGEKRESELTKIRILVKDPSPDPLTVGMTIPAEEHDWMIKLGTYTPGTEIRQGDERRRIDKIEGKLVEVRI